MQLDDIQPTIDGLLALDHPAAEQAVTLIRELSLRREAATAAEVTVDLIKNTVGRRGHIVKVSPHQAVLVYRLLQAGADADVTADQLQSALYGRRGTEHNVGTLRVQMTDLRKRLAPLRVWILNTKGRGYRVAFAPIKE